jgi:hypothetical protein
MDLKQSNFYCQIIDIKRKYRFLMVCYVPATSATFFFFFHFLLPPLAVLMRQTRQAVHAINQSIFLRCLWVKIHRHLRKVEQWPKLQEIVVSVALAKVMVPHYVTKQQQKNSWHSHPLI